MQKNKILRILHIQGLKKCLRSPQLTSHKLFIQSSLQSTYNLSGFHHNFSTLKQQTFQSELDEVLKTKGSKKLRGRLVICPTPLGNIKDVSIRQYESFLDCDIIACESTKITEELFQVFKEKNLKENFYEKFEINLGELKNDNTSSSEGQEEDLFFSELEQPEFVTESKQIFPELEFFSFMQNPDLINDETLFTKEDKFKYLLKQKIKDLKETKGRGLLINFSNQDDDSKVEKLLKCLQYNFKVGLVVNQGTPALMDLGYKLINKAHNEDVFIEALPGASVFSVALSLSGFPSDRFLYKGYLPSGSSEKKTELEKIKEAGITCVLMEKIDKVLQTLVAIEKVYGEEQLVSLEGNLIGTNEMLLRGRAKDVYERIEKSGRLKELEKVIIIVAPHSASYNKILQESQETPKKVETNIPVHIDHLVKVMEDKLDAKDQELANILSEILKIPKKKAMRYVKRDKSNT